MAEKTAVQLKAGIAAAGITCGRDPAEGTYRKLCFKNRKFCGGILFGDVDMTTELIEAYEEGTLFENISI